MYFYFIIYFFLFFYSLAIAVEFQNVKLNAMCVMYCLCFACYFIFYRITAKSLIDFMFFSVNDMRQHDLV